MPGKIGKIRRTIKTRIGNNAAAIQVAFDDNNEIVLSGSAMSFYEKSIATTVVQGELGNVNLKNNIVVMRQ